MKHFAALQQPQGFKLAKRATFLAAICLGQSTYAQTTEVEGAMPDPTHNVSEAINECYRKVPLTESSQFKVHVILAIDGSGALASAPLATELNYSTEKRRLFRKVMLAIVRCTPFQEDGLSPAGEFILTVSQDEISVDALYASLQPVKEMMSLPNDYLAPAEQAPSTAPAATKEIEDELQLSRHDRREIQHRLRLVSHDPGDADGVFGPKTRSAISDWQVSQGLPSSGYLSKKHLGALNKQSEVRYKRFKEDNPPKKPRRVRLCKRGVLGVLYDCRYVWR